MTTIRLPNLNLTKVLVALVSMMLVGLVSPHAAHADPKDDKKEARKEAKDERKEAKDERKEAKKDLHDAIRDGGRDSQAAKDAKAALGEARRKLKENREERRSAAKTALKAKWGEDFLKKPAVRAELRIHAHHMAKLHHMKRIADASDKKNLEERINKLTEKEEARHQARMDALKAKNGEDSK